MRQAVRINSPSNTELKYFPGLGFFDGTTCETWPGTIHFGDQSDTVGNLTEVLNQLPTGNLPRVRELVSRMDEIGMNSATVFGSKRELVLFNTRLDPDGVSELITVAVDPASGRGFALDNAWLCTQSYLRSNPLNCEEKPILPFEDQTYTVLAKTTRGGTAQQPVVTHNVVLTAPRIRLVGAEHAHTLDVNVHLMLLAQRVFAGDGYVDGEDLSQRPTSLMLRAQSVVAELPEFPTEALWTAALETTARPAFIAIVADEVGGIREVSALSHATVENVVVDNTYDQPARYNNVIRQLNIRPDALFTHSDSYTVRVSPVEVPLRLWRLDYDDLPGVRTGADVTDRGAAIVLAGDSTDGIAVSASEPGHLSVLPGYASLFEYAEATTDEFADIVSTGSVNFDILPPASIGITVREFSSGGRREDSAYLTDPAYKQSRLQLVADALAEKLFQTFSQVTQGGTPPRHDNYTAIASDVADARFGLHLLSRGVFFQQLFASADTNSLRTGVVSPRWTDAWELTSDASLQLNETPDLDIADLGIDLDKRARAEHLSQLVDLQQIADLDVRANALGLRYGSVAMGFHALSTQGSSDSIYKADERWANLVSMVDAFDDATSLNQDVLDAAQKQALLGITINLRDGLLQSVDNLGEAADDISLAASSNAVDQGDVLVQLNGGFESLVDINQDLLDGMGTVFGCDAATSPTSCIQAIDNKRIAFEDACDVETGLDWLRTVVSIAKKLPPPAGPALSVADKTVQSVTGRNIVDNMQYALEATAVDRGHLSPETVDTLEDFLDAEADMSSLVAAMQQATEFSRSMREVAESADLQCDAGGQAETNLRNFISDIVVYDTLIQSLSTQLGLVYAQMQSVTSQINYLLAETDAYQDLVDNNQALKDEVNQQTQPVIDLLSAAGDLDFSVLYEDQRNFLTQACETTLQAIRVSQADLYLISQFLETATGRATTSPELVIPSYPEYRFADGASPAGLFAEDVRYGYLISLWDRGAFESRFNSAGSGTTDNYLALAGDRFTHLVGQEICSVGDGKLPKTRLVVRKIVDGQAFKTLVSEGKVDFEVTLDDLVRGGNRNSDGVRAPLARDLMSQAYEHDLAGAFVIKAGYAVCNGPPGDECCADCRIDSGDLGDIDQGSGSLNNVYLVNRGQGQVPVATLGTDDELSCSTTAVRTVSNEVVQFENRVDATVSTCLVPVVTPREYAGMSYYDNAAAPDTQLLIAQLDDSAYCSVTPEVLTAGPLQGLPVLGSWALARNSSEAEQLKSLNQLATIDPAELPDVEGASAIEVMMLVGIEPKGSGQPASYLLTDNTVIDLVDFPVGPGTTQASLAFRTDQFLTVGDQLLVDVFLPENQPNPYWLGSLQIRVSIPSENLEADLGTLQLTGLPLGEITTLSFAVPPAVQDVIRTTTAAGTFIVSATLPNDAPPALLSNLRFDGNEIPRSIAAGRRGTIEEIFSFEGSDWTSSAAVVTNEPSLVTDGIFGLAVQGRTDTHTPIRSAEFFTNELVLIGHQLLVDVYYPTQPVWGDLQAYVSCPFNQNEWIDQVQLSAFEPGQFNSVVFDVPDGVFARLNTPDLACSFTLVVNAPLDAEFVFDNLRMQ